MYFRDVAHQSRAIGLLHRALDSGRSHHGYLFAGPEGVGKECTAHALAARLLCEAPADAPDHEPCGRCRACQLFAAANHPDFHLVHRGLHRQHPDRTIRASKGLFLVVDLVRHFLIEPANTKPALGQRRVFVVRDAERMNEEAQNALLKTLEEPPGEARLILLSSSAQRLLPTIRSRCQLVQFGLLPREFVQTRLAAAGADATTAGALALLSGGRLGPALRWERAGVLSAAPDLVRAVTRLTVATLETFGKEWVENAAELAIALREADSAEPEDEAGDDAADEARNRRPGAKAAAPGTDELRGALKLQLALLAAALRDALVAEAGAGQLTMLPPTAQLARPPAPLATETGLQRGLAAVTTAERMLDRNVNPQLVCERLGAALLGLLPALDRP